MKSLIIGLLLISVNASALTMAEATACIKQNTSAQDAIYDSQIGSTADMAFSAEITKEIEAHTKKRVEQTKNCEEVLVLRTQINSEYLKVFEAMKSLAPKN